MSAESAVILCPGQGAQAVGMGRTWRDASAAAAAVFKEADALLTRQLGAPLSELCFDGPAQRLNQTDVSQPAIYTCSIACWRGMQERGAEISIAATAGLSLGEYTALHLGGVFDFATGLELVATRGRLMQRAAESSRGGMVALIGADEQQAEAICRQAAGGGVLVAANFNAPGQIVLSGDEAACQRAITVAAEMGLKATPLAVAGAFHSPLMQSAADGLASALELVRFSPPTSLRAGAGAKPGAGAAGPGPGVPVWSNVTAKPHPAGHPGDLELLKRRLVEQIVSPVRWSQTCQGLVQAGFREYHELGPGSVLKGLMRRIDRNAKVTNHDQPQEYVQA